jgi:hypothetical protein
MVSLRGPLARAALAVRRFEMYATTRIRTQDLRDVDLPPAGSDWAGYAAFALTFDPAERYRSPEDCAELANWAFSRWQKTGRLPGKLEELRGCLWFEQRRARFLGRASPEAKNWASALVAEMRWHLRGRLKLSA